MDHSGVLGPVLPAAMAPTEPPQGGAEQVRTAVAVAARVAQAGMGSTLVAHRAAMETQALVDMALRAMALRAAPALRSVVRA